MPGAEIGLDQGFAVNCQEMVAVPRVIPAASLFRKECASNADRAQYY